MKLSKKVTIIFTVATCIAITLFFISFSLLGKRFFNEDLERAFKTANNCIKELETECEKVRWKSKEYVNLIKIANNISNEYGEKGLEVIGLNEKFTSDSIDYKLILKKNYEEVSDYFDVTVSENKRMDLLILKEKVKNYLINNNLEELNSIVTTESSPYILSINRIYRNDDQEDYGYFIVLEAIDKEDFTALSIEKDEAIQLVTEIPNNKEINEYTLEDNKKISLIYTDDSIIGYYKIPMLMGDTKYYINFNEELMVKEGASKVNILMLVIQITIFLSINIILYRIIENVLIKRINKITKGINDAKSLDYRIEDIKGNDEISLLAKDVNKMLNTLEESNNIIIKSNVKYTKLFNSLTNGIAYVKIIRDENGKGIDACILDINKAFKKLVGLEDVLDEKLKVNLKQHKDRFPVIEEIIDSVCKKGRNFLKKSYEINGTWMNIACSLIEEDSFSIVLTDITESKNYSDDMRFLANNDVLTGLPNRYNLFNYMGQLKYEKKEFAIFFIDLDNFKSLNDTLGHNSGDEVLCEAAKTLTFFNQKGVTIGRIGGDEFLIVREGKVKEEEINELGKEILKALNKTFKYKNYTYELKASMGVSYSPKHSTDIETLIKYADIAMYKSKKAGGNRVVIFSKEMSEEILMETKLKKSIERGEIVPYYQPIYDVKDNKISGAEVLVRWNCDGKVVEPCKFVPIAKRNGYILEIDTYIFKKACVYCKEKQQEGYENFIVSVNASYRFLNQPNLKEILKETIEKEGIKASSIKFEITEDEVLDKADNIISTLRMIREMGFKVALDDFGIEYSSFNHIKMLPIDTIKIDRSLLLTVENDKKTLFIIETLIKLAHVLDLDVVCEGVEITAQLNLLRKLHCDRVQGYLISKPVPKDEFDKLLKK